MYGILIDESHEMDAQTAMSLLQSSGIGTRPFFFPMHKQPVFKKMGLFDKQNYPNAEKMYRNGFYIPSGLALSDIQMERVVRSLIKIFD